MLNLGTVRPGATIRIPFSTFDKDDGSSVTMTNYAAADILVYKDGSTTERASTAGFTATTDFDSKTGKHLAVIDLSDDTTADFWKAGSEYLVAIDAVTVDGVTTGGWIARFTIGYGGANLDTFIASLTNQTSFTLNSSPAEDDALNGHWAVIHDKASAVQRATVLILDYTGSTKTVTLAAAPTFTITAGDNVSVMDLAPLQPTTLGRTIDVSAGGEAGVDWANIGSPTTAVNLSGTTVKTSTEVAAVTSKLDTMLEAASGSPGEYRFTADAIARLLTVIGMAAGNLDAQLAAHLAAIATRASQTSLDTLDDYVDTEVAAIKAKTDNLPSDPADASDIAAAFAVVNATLGLVSAVTARLDTLLQPAGGSPSDYEFSADALRHAPSGGTGGGGGPSAGAIADAVWDEATSGHVAGGSFGAAIAALVGLAAKLESMLEAAGGSPGDYRLSADAVRHVLDAVPTAIEAADALLERDIGSGTNAGTPEERTVRSALRFLRNKWSISGSTLTVRTEDDSTTAWTAAVATQAGADPVVGNDPT